VLILYQQLRNNRAQAADFLRQALPVQLRIDGLDKVCVYGLEGVLLDLCIRYHHGPPHTLYVYQQTRWRFKNL
jgi:hypothetical protein